LPGSSFPSRNSRKSGRFNLDEVMQKLTRTSKDRVALTQT
jgi:hypothetical protein